MGERERIEIRGPYYEPRRKRKKWRINLVCTVGDTSRATTLRFAAEHEACAAIAVYRRADPTAQQIGDALGRYELHQREKGLTLGTVVETGRILRRFLEVEKTTRDLTADYLRGRIEAGRACGRAVDTLATELRTCKTFLRWLGLEVPEVRVEGRRRRGAESKQQLTADQARAFVEAALEERCDVAAAVLAPLLMAVSGVEILHRQPRDLDEGGAVLWVRRGKTAQRRRRVEIPELLRPLFEELAAGKGPTGWLFEAAGGGPRSKTWARDWTRELARRAGIPDLRAEGETTCGITPHGLRGTHATLATAAGATGHLVAATLGHAPGSATTERHYTQRAATDAAAQRRALLRVIGGGK